MSFELFREKRNVIRYHEGKGVPIVSIYRSGHLAINKLACVKYDLPKYRYVEIFYDKETQDVGLKLYSEKTEHCYVGRTDSSKGKTHHRGYQFQCKSFFKLIGYEKNYSQGFEIFKVENMYVFNLNNPLGGENKLAQESKPKSVKRKKKRWIF